jgi:hypothetical protein
LLRRSAFFRHTLSWLIIQGWGHRSHTAQENLHVQNTSLRLVAELS